MKLPDVPTFLDFEASSLAIDSYPIEVAWNDAAGKIESYLISPAGVANWTDWDMQAQALHGITRKELLAHGKTPAWVCQRIRECLAGRTLYSDNPDYEEMWLTTLFAAAGAADNPTLEMESLESGKFAIEHVDELLIQTVCRGMTRGRAKCLYKIDLMKHEARQLVAGIHRAGWDVEYLVKLWRLTVKHS